MTTLGAAVAGALVVATALSLRTVIRAMRRRRDAMYAPLSRSALRIATDAARNGARR